MLANNALHSSQDLTTTKGGCLSILELGRLVQFVGNYGVVFGLGECDTGQVMGCLDFASCVVLPLILGLGDFGLDAVAVG